MLSLVTEPAPAPPPEFPAVDYLVGYAWFVWSPTGQDLPVLPGRKLCDYRIRDRYGVIILTQVPVLIGPGVCRECGQQRAVSCNPRPLLPRLPEGLDTERWEPSSEVVLHDADLRVIALRVVKLIDRDQPHRCWMYAVVRL